MVTETPGGIIFIKLSEISFVVHDIFLFFMFSSYIMSFNRYQGQSMHVNNKCTILSVVVHVLTTYMWKNFNDFQMSPFLAFTYPKMRLRLKHRPFGKTRAKFNLWHWIDEILCEDPWFEALTCFRLKARLVTSNTMHLSGQ